MNKSQALEYLNNEQQMLQPGHTSNLFLEAISILSDSESTSFEKDCAFQILDNIYYSGILFMDRNELGQAILCLSIGVDPMKPFPTQRPH